MDDELLLVPCPFPDRTNPMAGQATRYVREVAGEIGLRDAASRKVLHGMALGEAAGLTYPDADLDRLQVATMWIAFLVLFDDAWSDLLELRGGWLDAVLAEHRRIHQVLDGRPATAADDGLTRLLDRLLRRIAEIDPGWDGGRLRHEIKRYLAATVWELNLRSQRQVPDLAAYLRMRRVFSTMTVQLEMDYFVCRLELPGPLRSHPCLQLVDEAVADYGCIANDLYSLAAERQRGISSNIITVLEHEYGWDTPTATGHARRLCAQAIGTYQRIAAEPARFGLPDGRALSRYLDHYQAFMSAAARWPARSARYRGTPAGPASGVPPLTTAKGR